MIFFLASYTVTGTKSRMNIHVLSCSAVCLCQLKCAIYNMTVYHCTSYSVVVVSMVQLPMYVIAFRSTILLEAITSVNYCHEAVQ